MRIHTVLLVASFFGALASASPSYAQPAPAAPVKSEGDALTKKARQLYAEGVKSYQQAKWEDARASFLAAWALAKHYTIAGNLADCEMRLGLYRDAAEHLAYYVREVVKDDTSTADERKDGQRHYDEARGKVASLSVRVNVPAAQLYVDDKLIGKSPLIDPLFLDTGSHVLEARSEGYPSVKAVVDAKPGMVRDIVLELKRADGVPPVLPPSAGLSPVWVVVSGALAAGGLGAGIGLTAAANGKHSDAQTIGDKLPGRSVCTGTPAAAFTSDCSTLKATLSQQSTLSTGALVSFVAGGTLALVTVGLGVWGVKAPSTKVGFQVAPIVGSREGGIVFGGVW
jgi:hypothetical protein